MQKYGIDGIQNEIDEIVCDDSNRNNTCLGLNSAGRDDWDRFMDDTNDDIFNVSFSATSDDIKGVGGVGYSTPSPDQSSDDDDDSSGNVFFENKAAVQSLETPEKFRYKFGDDHERTKTRGITYARGMQEQDGSSESDNSPNPSTNVSSTSTGSVLTRMFKTVLRFNDEFDELSSDEAVSDGDRSSEDDHINDKNNSVSFAADTSFGFNDGFGDPSFMNEEESSLDAAQSNDKDQRTDKNNSISFAADKSIASSESKYPPSSSFSCSPNKRHEANVIRNASSPASQTTCQRNNREMTMSPAIGSRVKSYSGPTNLSLSGLSPIGSLGVDGQLKSPRSVPFDKTPLLDEVTVLPHPDVHVDCQSHFYQANECTNRRLFQETESKSSSPCLDHSHDRNDVIRNKSFDQCCTQSTVASVESFFEATILTSPSEEVSPFSYSRTFGSNAAFWINSTAAASTTIATSGGACNKISESKSTENRRGVTLFRSAKLKALGLGYKLSQNNRAALEEYGDSSF